MKPYDENATCPKCGGAEVATRHERDAHHRDCPLRETLSRPDCCTAEHLCRTCRCCGYEWAESVLQ